MSSTHLRAVNGDERAVVTGLVLHPTTPSKSPHTFVEKMSIKLSIFDIKNLITE